MHLNWDKGNTLFLWSNKFKPWCIYFVQCTILHNPKLKMGPLLTRKNENNIKLNSNTCLFPFEYWEKRWKTLIGSTGMASSDPPTIHSKNQTSRSPSPISRSLSLSLDLFSFFFSLSWINSLSLTLSSVGHAGEFMPFKKSTCQPKKT
jgi:hypothetical protein